MRYQILSILTLAFILVSFGCIENAASSDAELANPAAVHCIEQGFDYDVRIGEGGGQYGVCIFEDGSECDGWAYFRGECAPGE